MDKTEAWASIARVSSLAELGFFESLLEGAGIDSRVEQRPDFDAASGQWASAFVLQVPSEQSRRAAEIIESELIRSPEDEEHPDTTFGIPNPGTPGWKPLGWPLAWVLIAGGLAWWGTRLVMHAPQPKPPSRGGGSLSDALGELRGPLRTQSAPGNPTSELGFDRQRGRIYLLEDRDGDGEPDRYREFHNGRLVLEQQQ